MELTDISLEQRVLRLYAKVKSVTAVTTFLKIRKPTVFKILKDNGIATTSLEQRKVKFRDQTNA